jgi:hypothetical protein
MKKFIRKAAGVAAASAALLGPTATSAYAGPPWMLTNPNANGTVSAISFDMRMEIWRDVNGDGAEEFVTSLTCTDVSVWGIVPTQLVTFPDIGVLDGSQWNTCKVHGIAVTVAHNGIWDLHLDGDRDANPPGPDDEHRGHVTLSASMSGLGGACTATFGGSAPGYYKNSTQTFTLDPAEGTNSLSAMAANCAGIIQPGDEFRLYGRFIVTDPTGPSISISG